MFKNLLICLMSACCIISVTIISNLISINIDFEHLEHHDDWISYMTLQKLDKEIKWTDENKSTLAYLSYLHMGNRILREKHQIDGKFPSGEEICKRIKENYKKIECYETTDMEMSRIKIR